MFCKWCGNTIKTTDKECPSCGRETPPLSDCGGFYDLKRPWDGAPIPTGSPTPAAGGDPATEAELLQLREEKENIRQEAEQKQKRLTILCGVLAAAFFIVLILWIVALSGDDSTVTPVPVGNNPVTAESTSLPEETTEPGIPPESTGTTEPLETTAETRTVTVTLLGEEKVSVSGCDAHKILTRKDDEMTAEFYWELKGSDSQTNEEAQSSTSFDYENADKLTLSATWHRKFKDAILLSCDAEAMTGFANAEISYLWQWATIPVQAAEGEAEQAVEWNHIVIDEALSAEPGQLPEEALPTGLEESGIRQIQLRCTVSVTSEAGEIVTVELGGFLVEPGDAVISFPELTQKGSN